MDRKKTLLERIDTDMKKAFVLKALFLRKCRKKTHRYNVRETKSESPGVKPGGGQSMGKKQSITITEGQTGRIMNTGRSSSYSSLCS